MSSVEVAANGPDKSASAPVGMVSHLKHLIESLPVCVMRSDLDGCLLAANDSALQLLGVSDHAKVLGKSLSERISAEHTEDWRGFLQRGWSEGASSVECELVDYNGAHRIIMIKAVARPTHADGIQSLILTAQDLSSRRRLERALNEHQGCATTIDALQTELQQSESERQRLVTLVETLQTATAGTAAECESAGEPLAKQTEELQGALAASEQEWQKRCEELTAQLAEQQQLAVLLEQRDADRQRLLDESAAREAEQRSNDEALRERVAELERSAVTSDKEWQTRCGDLTAQLAVHEAERQKLAKALEERDAEHQQLSSLLEQREAECQRLSNALESPNTGQQMVDEPLQQRIQELQRSLKATELEWQKRCDDLTAHLAEQAAARLQLSTALAQRDEDHREATADFRHRIEELERVLKANEQEWKTRSEEASAQLAAVSAERDQLARLLEQRSTESRATGDSLQQRIDELQRALKASEEEWQARRADWTSELAAHAAECERLSALLKQRDDEQLQLAESLKQSEREHQRLSEVLKERDVRHQAAVESLQQQIAECERALTENDEAWKQRCEELASELTAKDEERKRRWEQLNAQLLEHANERQRLSEQLEAEQLQQRRLIDDHASEKIRIEQTIRGECEHTLAKVDEGRRRDIETLRIEMQQLAEDLQRTAGQLAERTAEYERLTAKLHARDAGGHMDPADVQRLMKSVAAYRIELVQVTENTIRTLEPMATAGRVAIASSRELQEAVEAVDARSRQLLEQCALDDVNRPEIESLRRESIGAASLVRQLLQVFGESTRSMAQGPGETS